MKRKRSADLIMPLLLSCSLLLAGCAGTYGAPGMGKDPISEEAESFGEVLTAEWWENGFQESASGAAEIPYYELRRSPCKNPDIDVSAFWQKEIFAFSWDARYLFDSAETSDGWRYFLTCQKEDLETEKPKEILTDGQECPEGYGICMDVSTEDRIAVLFYQKVSSSYQLLTLNEKGELLDVRDVTAAYRELEISQEQLSEPGSWWCDGDGYQYLISPDRTSLAVIDPTGKVLLQKECGGEGESFAGAFHTPDGSVVFSKGDLSGGGSKLFRIEVPSGTEKILYQCGEMLLKQFTATPQGLLYYSSGETLWMWDLRSGEKTKLFSYSGSGISPNDRDTGQTCWLTVSGEGKFLLYDTAAGNVSAFADQMPVTGEEITCVMMSDLLNYIRPNAVVFSRDYGGRQITVEVLSGLLEDNWALLSARVAAGNIPDIMVVNGRDQVTALQEAGALAPLEEYLDKKTVDSLFAGARMAGTIDGKLYGILPVAMAYVPAVSAVLWKEDSWTLGDILDLAENRDLEGLYYDPFNGGGSPSDSLNFLLGGPAGKNPFYSEESGVSNFDSEDFCRLLEICRKYGDMSGVSEEQAREWLAQGKILALKEWIRNIAGYAELRDDYGGAVHFVGYPGQEDGVGIYVSTCYVLVGKNAKYQEETAAFLEYLLSEEALEKTEFMTLTRPSAENSIYAYETSDGTTMVSYKGGKDLPVREDGSSYLEEYLEFMDRLGSENSESPIREIISEETQPFWNGTKSAEEVAEIIDNRVQLYLDER